MKITTKQLTTTALLLAICIISQYFKNFSVYITGPIVNTTIILATLASGIYSGILLSVVAPITAFFFTGSPIMAGIPLMFPVIMLGNIILVVFTYYFENKIHFKYHLETGLIIGSFVKGIFMGVVIVMIIFPLFGENIAPHLPKPEMLPKVLATAKVTFSVTQVTTALIASVLSSIIWIPLKKVIKNETDN